MNIISKRLSIFIALIFGSTFGSTVYLRSVRSHDIGWRWFQLSVKFQDVDTIYQTAINNASLGYGSTDFQSSLETNYSSRGVINYYQEYNGYGYSYGYAIPWSGSKNCVTFTSYTSTENCNTTTSKVDYGQVFINMFYSSWITAHADYLMKHEAGHVLGMSHGPCSEVSVMREPSCGLTLYGTLQSHDVNTMKSWY